MRNFFPKLSDRARSFFEVNWFSFWHLTKSNKFFLFFSIGILFVGASSAASNLFQSSLVPIVLGVIGLSGVLLRVRQFLVWVARRGGVRLYRDPSIKNIVDHLRIPSGPSIEQAQSVVLAPTRSEFPEIVVRDSRFDRLVREDDVHLSNDKSARVEIDVVLSSSRDVYDSALREQRRWAVANKKQFVNEAKVCLADDPSFGSSPIRIFKSDYYRSFLTNELSTRIVETIGPQPERIFIGSEYFPATKEGAEYFLKPISDSRMNNDIGISTIALTSDRRLVLWRQSGKALQSELLVAPTGSGSCDWCDYQDLPSAQKTLRGLITRAMERELMEESSLLRGEAANAKIETRVLGYFRWVAHGGKPEFVGISKISRNAHQLKPNPSEVDRPRSLTTYPAQTIELLKESIGRILGLGESLSVPLWVNLLCLEEAIDQKNESLVAFLK